MKKKELKEKIKILENKLKEKEKQIEFYNRKNPELQKEYFNWRRIIIERCEELSKDMEFSLLYGSIFK